MVDNSTKVAELIIKSEIRVTNIDREVVLERDEDFLKKVQMKVKIKKFRIINKKFRRKMKGRGKLRLKRRRIKSPRWSEGPIFYSRVNLFKT
jgi:hypothetical protein